MTDMTELAEKERELKLLDEQIARYRAHRPTWPIYAFALSLLLGLLALRL
jgi:hypothetical protein